MCLLTIFVEHGIMKTLKLHYPMIQLMSDKITDALRKI